MSATETPTHAKMAHVLDRVLVGVDRSDASIEAARQAAVLTEHYGQLTLIGVYSPMRAMGLDLSDALNTDEARRKADKAVAAAQAAIASLVAPDAKVARGFSWRELIEEAKRERATLIVVGTHGGSRAEGILSASTATELVHKAPCSVLVARPATDRFPQRIVVGLDGSLEAARAYAAARRIAARFGSVLWPVVAHGGEPVDMEEIAKLTGGRHEELPDHPVAALIAASVDADLVVVGSRGLHGLKALGSVSERLAHRAHCSTLIVRDPDAKPTAAAAAGSQ